MPLQQHGADITSRQTATATSRTPGAALPLVSDGGVLSVLGVRCLGPGSNSWSPAASGGGHEDRSHEPHSGPRDHGSNNQKNQ